MAMVFNDKVIDVIHAMLVEQYRANHFVTHALCLANCTGLLRPQRSSNHAASAIEGEGAQNFKC
jgi:hypothetical protein